MLDPPAELGEPDQDGRRGVGGQVGQPEPDRLALPAGHLASSQHTGSSGFEPGGAGGLVPGLRHEQQQGDALLAEAVLEGILYADHYGDMLARLRADHRGPTHGYYLDVPFEETVACHGAGARQEERSATAFQGRDYVQDITVTTRDGLPGTLRAFVGDYRGARRTSRGGGSSSTGRSGLTRGWPSASVSIAAGESSRTTVDATNSTDIHDG
ncbi:hypothetical protein [Streptomyces sp. NPDC006971]|uniref:hypothetical protein n=1 Tax=Streptomyces sp. NPDC006971 TaxID=3154784 RepID=UPI0033EDE576